MDLHEISKDEENFQKFIIDKYKQFCKEDEKNITAIPLALDGGSR